MEVGKHSFISVWVPYIPVNVVEENFVYGDEYGQVSDDRQSVGQVFRGPFPSISIRLHEITNVRQRTANHNVVKGNLLDSSLELLFVNLKRKIM